MLKETEEVMVKKKSNYLSSCLGLAKGKDNKETFKGRICESKNSTRN